MESCGLSPEAALSASKRVHFESSKGPDSVLTLLRNYGFGNAHISRMIGRCPKLLSANPERTLVPELEFFRSKGLSGSELPKVFYSCPNLFFHSLEKQVAPLYDFIKIIVGHDSKVIVAMRRGWQWILRTDVRRRVFPNVVLLKEFGEPQSIIVYLASTYPAILSIQRERFGEKAKEVIEMGFNPSQTGFVYALVATIQMRKSMWQHKVEVYKKWEWSDTEIGLAFRKNPVCFRLYESKIKNGMDFLVNNIGFQSTAIARNPTVLTYSSKKRIIPWWLVVKFLKLKGSGEAINLSKCSQYLNYYITK